jgi:hypothetical protein
MPKITVNVDNMPIITLDQAKALTLGTILYHRQHRNADGSAQRWRVNGKVKTWKRSPERVRVPLKHGLYNYDYLTEYDLDLLSLKSGEED